MKGSQYIAKFLKAIGVNQVFQVQGGAISFIVDAITQEPQMQVVCFQHEQAAAMAADAVYRTNGKLGVSMATSGPGASNLITGIACGYYDSIPSLHIAGQVNYEEQKLYRGAAVRQAGFQQMDIVSMVKPVCKYAVSVTSHDQMRYELQRCVEEAYSGRMGPVLIDIPMNLQNSEMEHNEILLPKNVTFVGHGTLVETKHRIKEIILASQRPLVIFGAGVGLAAQQALFEQWLINTKIPFVATWAALNYFKHDISNYVGHFGVYGNRGGNFAVQNADHIIVFGSRLDNRQRSGNPANFAPNAKVTVLDIDPAELDKLDQAQYTGIQVDLGNLDQIIDVNDSYHIASEWVDYIDHLKQQYFNRDTSVYSKSHHVLNPYQVVEKLLSLADEDAVITTDAGANHCWVYQTFYRNSQQLLMTSSGHYAMGYALPASIGAALVEPGKQQICCNGDGGIQMNLQELQTVVEYNLDIKVVIFNNHGLGMIKQFQDTYMNGRYAATDQGPGRPDFARIAQAFDFDYALVQDLNDINETLLRPGRRIIEIVIAAGTPIEPKLEMGRPLNDQSPLLPLSELNDNNRWSQYVRKV